MTSKKALALVVTLLAVLATMTLPIMSGCSEPTPVEPTPAEPTPAEPTPAEPVTGEPTPAEPTPAEPTPAEPAEKITLRFISGTPGNVESSVPGRAALADGAQQNPDRAGEHRTDCGRPTRLRPETAVVPVGVQLGPCSSESTAPGAADGRCGYGA